MALAVAIIVGLVIHRNGKVRCVEIGIVIIAAATTTRTATATVTVTVAITATRSATPITATAATTTAATRTATGTISRNTIAIVVIAHAPRKRCPASTGRQRTVSVTIAPAGVMDQTIVTGLAVRPFIAATGARIIVITSATAATTTAGRGM